MSEVKESIANEGRYLFAKIYASFWFSELEKMNAETVNELKSYLNNHTFIGEFCGNPEQTHLVNYDSQQIRFFGIIDKNETFDAINPINA